jgi:hypothetical protein
MTSTKSKALTTYKLYGFSMRAFYVFVLEFFFFNFFFLFNYRLNSGRPSDVGFFFCSASSLRVRTLYKLSVNLHKNNHQMKPMANNVVTAPGTKTIEINNKSYMYYQYYQYPI